MRNFKIDSTKYTIVDICNSTYKYEVLKFDKEKQCWISMFECNTLREGKEKAEKFYLEGLKLNEQDIYYQEKLKEKLKYLSSKTVYCIKCNTKLSLQEKLDGLDKCFKCLLHFD